jgi:Alpha/beta hydrolase family
LKRAIVYVHGLWLTGLESGWLRGELARELGAEMHLFKYPSVGDTVEQNAAALREFLRKIPADELHVVGHSLGGLVILRAFEMPLSLPPGRIVLLGSPVRGSSAAQHLAQLPFGLSLLGRGVEAELLDKKARHWHGSRELGVIAGDVSIGLGKLIGHFNSPNDGSILLEETMLPGAADRIVLHTSHTAMLFSSDVAAQIIAFLKSGAFLRGG